ncbi:carbohydrate kinase family protein [Patescibacteria group bacterium]|nr:carbohydrate kinase family protein [Patescibacteria group bacterium]
MFDIVSIGAATVDIFIKSESFSVQDNSSCSNNLSLVLPYASKEEINQSLICSGGGATNSSVAFSRLGLKSACVSLFGQDNLSNYVLTDLKNEKVNYKHSIRLKKDNTDFSVIIIAPDGARTILVNRGSSCLEKQHIDWDFLKKTKWLYITSLEGNLDLLENLIGFGTENNIKISLNPGSRELAQKKLLKSFLPYIDFLLLNKEESETLAGLKSDHRDFWSELKSTGSKITAVTKGRNGAYIISDSQTIFSPIISTVPQDETGAGDSFGSAFVAGLIHQQDLQTCLNWAIHNSASVVSHLGAKTGLLTLSKIKKQTKLNRPQVSFPN